MTFDDLERLKRHSFRNKTVSRSPAQQERQANAKVSAQQPWYIGRKSLNRPPL